MAVDALRVDANERIDLQDFQGFVAAPVIQAARTAEAVLTSPDKAREWILDGFAISNPSAKQLQVTKGRAILSRRDGAQIFHGLVTTEGDATKIVDMATFSAGVYGVYVRFEFVDGDSASRIFWNNTGDGFEYSQTMPTRRLANWSLRVESSSPGTEWLLIGTVSQAAMTITDKRPFYYEGTPDTTYQSGWGTVATGGTANDRNSNRATNGVKDAQTFAAAMRQSIEDIKGRGGLRRWWDEDVGGLNVGFIANAVEDRIAAGDATFYMQGSTTVPAVNFDTNDSLIYTRSSNRFDFSIGSAVKASVLQDGSGPALEVGNDANHRLIFTSTGPRWNVDNGDYLHYTRSSDRWGWYRGSSEVAFLDATAGLLGANFVQSRVGDYTLGGFSFQTDGSTGMFGDIGKVMWYTSGSKRAEIENGVNNSTLRCRGVSGILSLSQPTSNMDLVMRHAYNNVIAYGVVRASTIGFQAGFNCTAATKNGTGDWSISLTWPAGSPSTAVASLGEQSGTSPAFITCVFSTGSTIRVRTWNSAGSPTDLDFVFQVVGTPGSQPTQNL